MDLDQNLDIIFSFEFNIYSCSVDLLFDSVHMIEKHIAKCAFEVLKTVGSGEIWI